MVEQNKGSIECVELCQERTEPLYSCSGFLSFKTVLKTFPLFLQNKWLRSINQALDQVLGGGGEGSSPGVTGMSRTASYTFTGEGRFKDAQYTGSWMSGQVHGRCVCAGACLSYLHRFSCNAYVSCLHMCLLKFHILH